MNEYALEWINREIKSIESGENVNVEVMRLNVRDACSYNFIIKCLSKYIVLRPLTGFISILPTSDPTIPTRVVQ